MSLGPTRGMAPLRIILTSLACLALPVQGDQAPKFNWDSTKYVYAFGDSYTFVQGTAGFPNFSFIGDALHYSFTSQQILSNEIIPKNTSSEGSNWVEFLTGCFGGSPLECNKQLWDFAFAGSDIDAALLPLHHNFTIPLVDQVRQWATYASEVLPHPSAETLTLWWIGINDTGDTLSNATITDFAAFWETEMKSYFNAIQLANDEGLHIHLLLNVPPEERSPGTLGNPTKVATMKQHVDMFNAALANHTAAFAASNPGSIVMSFDAHGLFNTILDNPERYGFTNTTGFCTCTDPGFFWYNTGHPTELVHRLLAEAIAAQLTAASSD
ncbi:hypothetical protein C8J56DRAFT_911128 [Mycena floridula]|nr:hypothetical protein C8J56DRAFT_911128 [Mycena floridula]